MQPLSENRIKIGAIFLLEFCFPKEGLSILIYSSHTPFRIKTCYPLQRTKHPLNFQDHTGVTSLVTTWIIIHMEIKKMQREIHTAAARAAPGDLCLKSHPKDYQQKLTYHNGHPTKYRPRSKLLNLSPLSTLGLKSHLKDYQQKFTYTNTVKHPSTNRCRCCLFPVYQAVDRNSMPVTTKWRYLDC